jgi:peroxiredoxin
VPEASSQSLSPVSGPDESANKPSISVEPKTASTKRALFNELDKSFNTPSASLEPLASAALPPIPVETGASSINRTSSLEAVAVPPKPPVPIKPSAIGSRPRNPSSKWEIVYILMAGFIILATVAVIGYISIQHRAQAQTTALATAQNLQQTLAVAQILTNMPLPTLIPTWTLSPTRIGKPTVTFTYTPIPSPTLVPTATKTPRPPSQVGPAVGLYAPDFSLTDLASGKLMTLSQYDGQPVFIFFWAAWCIHCNDEIDSIEAISQANKAAGLVTLTVNAADDLATVTLYRSNHKLTIPILLDPDAIFKNAYAINLDTIPLHYFIDSGGMIKSIRMGEMTQAEIQIQVDGILQPIPTSTP